MATKDAPLNLAGKAPLVNVSLCMSSLDKAMNRKAHLPGITVFFGDSGFGKTNAATVAAVNSNAIFVRAAVSWTRKAVHLAILKEMGIKPAKTLYALAEQVAEELALSRRPLIIDECDYLVKNDTIEVIRDIYEGSGAAIMLIGEEQFPTKLKAWERFHGRVLDFVRAEPASLADARALCALYVDDVDVADDLLAHIHKEAKGSARRIVVNLERVREFAKDNGLTIVDKTAWGEEELFTGDAPKRGK